MRRGQAHHDSVATQTLLPTFLAQALAERGFLDQIAASLSSAKYQLELYVGQGNTIYVIVAVILVIVVTRVRRNR